MRVVISAGGTGGHIYPAVSIINKLKEKTKDLDLLYIGTTNRMEKDIIPNLGIEYIGINIRGLSKNPFTCFKALSENILAIRKCKKILKKFKPDIVIGVGGYVSVPVIYSAKSLGIKTLIHEQNSYPGKANRFLSKYCDSICISFLESKKYFGNHSNVIYTGNPRGEEAKNVKKVNKKKYGLTVSKKLVLIATGSLGATSINKIIEDCFPLFATKNYEVLLATGKANYEEIKGATSAKNIKIVPYIDDMLEVLNATDLIISRAGASTIAEITSLGIPSILIPSPYVANNHQYYNALSLADKKASIMIEEKNLNADILIKTIDDVLNNEDLYKEISKNAKSLGVGDSATKIYEEIKKLIN